MNNPKNKKIQKKNFLSSILTYVNLWKYKTKKSISNNLIKNQRRRRNKKLRIRRK